jgi:hypothetical protein
MAQTIVAQMGIWCYDASEEGYGGLDGSNHAKDGALNDTVGQIWDIVAQKGERCLRKRIWWISLEMWKGSRKGYRGQIGYSV